MLSLSFVIRQVHDVCCLCHLSSDRYMMCVVSGHLSSDRYMMCVVSGHLSSDRYMMCVVCVICHQTGT